MKLPLPSPIHRASAVARAIAFLLGLAAVGCNRSSDDTGSPLPTVSAPPSDATSSLFSDLGKSFLTGSAHGAGGTFTGWALGQLGLAGTDSSLSALNEIEATLQEIDMELQQIAAEISELITDEVVANCEELSSTLNQDLSRITTLIETYDTIICTGAGTCANGAAPSNVPADVLMSFMDDVLDADGDGSNSMDKILDRIQQALVGATQGGIIAACLNPAIPGLELPADDSFNDADYYTRVHPIASYYYYYQTVGTLLYCEAERYLAYLTSGAPDTSTLDPDDLKDYVLESTDPDVIFIVNETAQRMQTTWDNLRNQFNLVGAPYTNEDLILRVHLPDPVLYVLDVDAFAAAAGTTCSDLTTDDYACTSVLRGLYGLGATPIQGVHYSTQVGPWSFATLPDLSKMMDGWSSGEAWQYLALNNGNTTRGFLNLEDKVLITAQVNTATKTFTSEDGEDSTWHVNYVPFLDANLDYSTPGLNGQLPVQTSTALFDQMKFKDKSDADKKSVKSAERTSHDYVECDGTLDIGNDDATIQWSSEPGWLSSNTAQRATAFHFPVIRVDEIVPLEGLQATNAAGMYTMCTQDYEAWFEAVVPAPVFD